MSNDAALSIRAFLSRGVGSAAWIAAADGLLSPSLLRAATQRRDRPPNVLFIITDDQPLDAFGCLGGQGTERANAMKRYAKHYFDPDQLCDLCDLAEDPCEMANPTDDPAHTDVLSGMQARLRQWPQGTRDPHSVLD